MPSKKCSCCRRHPIEGNEADIPFCRPCYRKLESETAPATAKLTQLSNANVVYSPPSRPVPVAKGTCVICSISPALPNTLGVPACRRCLDLAARLGLESLAGFSGVNLSSLLPDAWTPATATITTQATPAKSITSSAKPAPQKVAARSAPKPKRKLRLTSDQPFCYLKHVRPRKRATALLATEKRRATKVVTTPQIHRVPDEPIPELMEMAKALPPVFDKTQHRKPIRTATVDDSI